MNTYYIGQVDRIVSDTRRPSYAPVGSGNIVDSFLVAKVSAVQSVQHARAIMTSKGSLPNISGAKPEDLVAAVYTNSGQEIGGVRPHSFKNGYRFEFDVPLTNS